MITPETASDILRTLWDDAAIMDPEAFDLSAQAQADTLLSAIWCEHRARASGMSGFVRGAIIQEAQELRHLADEMQSAVGYL